MGNVCHALDPRMVPPNVRMLGLLPDAERNVVLDFAHVALNPVSYGSGTNHKMLDYFAAGLPVVSTLGAMTAAARQLVEDRYDWAAIAARALAGVGPGP